MVNLTKRYEKKNGDVFGFYYGCNFDHLISNFYPLNYTKAFMTILCHLFLLIPVVLKGKIKRLGLYFGLIWPEASNIDCIDIVQFKGYCSPGVLWHCT